VGSFFFSDSGANSGEGWWHGKSHVPQYALVFPRSEEGEMVEEPSQVDEDSIK
jgi:hypothetical protein